MGKPSIFSREYERKMKRRKRNFIFFSLILIVLGCAVVLKFVYDPVNFDNIKARMQAWIDSDTEQDNELALENDELPLESTEKNNDNDNIDETQEIEEKYINIAQSSGNTAQAVYIEENGEEIFTEVRDLDTGVTFDISPSKKALIISDTNSVITLYKIDGSSTVVSKDKYVSTSGGVFTKENTLNSFPNYLWNSNPKFVNDNNIIFVTNRPYFKTSSPKQYLWMTNIEDQSDKIYWDLAGTNIEIGNKSEKGLEVTVDGRKYFIAEDGSYIQ